MRHGIKKIKFGDGKDANDMLLRKLAYNFLTHGYLKTTETKAKVLKQHVERLVEKMKTKSEANTNVLKKFLVSEELINTLYEQIPAAFGDVQGGYVRIQKLSVRYSDGAPMARISWTKPIVIQTEVTEAPAKKTAKKLEAKEEKPEVKEKKAKK